MFNLPFFVDGKSIIAWREGFQTARACQANCLTLARDMCYAFGVEKKEV